MAKLMLLFGTRPEAVKMCPLAVELRTRPEFQTVLCVTGQHRQMLDEVLDAFSLTPDYDLSVMRPMQTLEEITTVCLAGLPPILEKEVPDLVLVHGDTTTAFAGALAAFYRKRPVAHVEAGLRTYDLSAPFPEEWNRRAIDLLSRLCFAPTEQARQNLLSEGIPSERIWVTGNTGLDALRFTVREHYTHPILDWTRGCRLLLLTAHRRENWGRPLEGIFRAVRRIAEEYEDVRVVYPVHPNPQVRRQAEELLSGCSRIRLMAPLGPVDFHNIMARAYLVLTDSGGVQEEAVALHRPVLVLRDKTERPEGVSTGGLRLAGAEEKTVYDACCVLLEDAALRGKMARAENPFGDGFASQRIADILAGLPSL